MPTRPPRVLYIDHTARLGGGEVALLNLIAAMDRTRHEPVVLLMADGPLREKLEAIGVETTVLPLAASVADARKDALGGGTLLKVRSAAATATYVLRLRRAIRRSGAALVHTNSLKSDLIGGVAARLAGRPVVWHVRDRIADDYLPAKIVRLMRRLARVVPTAVIANSHATLRTLNPNEPAAAGRADGPACISKRRAWVVHDGTPVGEAPLPTPRTAQPGEGVVGLVGRLAPWKGQHVFIEAAARVRRRFPLARFRVIGAALFGEDEYERQLRATADAVGLTDALEFTGFRADVGAAIADLDLLAHASTTGEPFGQVIVEGMIAGKAVVATDGGGVPEIVVDGDTGLLVPMGDAAALAAAIERLLADPPLRDRMGRRGRERVLEHFTIAHVAAGMQRVFDEVLGSR